MCRLASDVDVRRHLPAPRVRVHADCLRCSAETVETDLSAPARRAVTLVFR